MYWALTVSQSVADPNTGSKEEFGGRSGKLCDSCFPSSVSRSACTPLAEQIAETQDCSIERRASSCAGDTTNVYQTTFIWMKNVVEILEELGAPLVHVYFTQGWVGFTLPHITAMFSQHAWVVWTGREVTPFAPARDCWMPCGMKAVCMCRQKYYGVHSGKWDIADVPWKDHPTTGNRCCKLRQMQRHIPMALMQVHAGYVSVPVTL